MIKKIVHTIKGWIINLAIVSINKLGGNKVMDVVYTTLIIAGRKTFKQVPACLKDEVRANLEAAGLGHLAQD